MTTRRPKPPSATSRKYHAEVIYFGYFRGLRLVIFICVRRYAKFMISASIFKFFIRNLWYFNFLYYLCTRFRLRTQSRNTCPDGGIGRRAGLKHQWGNPCRFDPGSGYNCTTMRWSQNKAKCCKSIDYSTFLFSKHQNLSPHFPHQSKFE